MNVEGFFKQWIKTIIFTVNLHPKFNANVTVSNVMATIQSESADGAIDHSLRTPLTQLIIRFKLRNAELFFFFIT